MKNPDKTILWFVFILALLLRIVGINHGFPFIHHPDEPALVRSALGLRFFPNPGHFDWPHLYMYVNYFMYMGFAFIRNVFDNLGFRPFLNAYFPILLNDDLVFYFLTRILTAVLGALSVIPVYLSGKRLFGTAAGIFSALVFALIPFHVQHSHYSLIDVPMVFFVCWSLYFCTGIFTTEDTHDYVGAGLNVGLAASTKYNGVFGAIAVFLTHVVTVIYSKEKPWHWKSFSKLLLAGVMAGIGFVLGTPYALLDYGTFSRSDGPKGAFWQFTNVGKVPDFASFIKNFFDIVFSKLFDDLGYTFLIVVFVVFVYLIFRFISKRTTVEDKYLWSLILFVFIFLGLISRYSHIKSQYILVIYPFVAVIVGWFLDHIYIQFQKRSPFIGFAVIALVLFIPAVMSFSRMIAFYRLDTRNELYTWLQGNVRPYDAFVYVAPEITPVLEKMGNTRYKSYTSLQDIPNAYVFEIESSSPELGKIDFARYGTRIKEVSHIDNTGRRGPDIHIYTYTK